MWPRDCRVSLMLHGLNKLNHLNERFSVIFMCILLKMLAGQHSDSNHLFTLNVKSCININVFTQIPTFWVRGHSSVIVCPGFQGGVLFLILHINNPSTGGGPAYITWQQVIHSWTSPQRKTLSSVRPQIRGPQKKIASEKHGSQAICISERHSNGIYIQKSSVSTLLYTIKSVTHLRGIMSNTHALVRSWIICFNIKD